MEIWFFSFLAAVIYLINFSYICFSVWVYLVDGTNVFQFRNLVYQMTEKRIEGILSISLKSFCFGKIRGFGSNLWVFQQNETV